MESFTSTAIHGTIWTTLQASANKVAALVATLIIARHLTEDDFGVAYFATTIGAFGVVLAPWVLNDLLVSMPSRFRQVAGTSLILGLVTATIFSALLLIAAPAIASTRPDMRWVAPLIAIAAMRPLADALMSTPWAKLRIELAYRKIAITDGVCQLWGSVMASLLALTGCGPFAVVAPPVAVLFLQAMWYWHRVRGQIPLEWNSQVAKPVARAFGTAALGQYLNNVVKVLELLVLGVFASTTQTGIFAFAFQLSTQANVILSNQVAGVMQPILSHINDTPSRQASAFLRALRLVGVIGVPLSLLQGAIASPCFHLLFGSKWNSAIPVFFVLSVMQAAIFLTTPILILLKAQGRFAILLAWQLAHILLGGMLMLVAVGLLRDSGPWNGLGIEVKADSVLPLGIAIAGTLIWAVGAPWALWASLRPAKVSMRHCLGILLQSWPLSAVATAVMLTLPRLMPFSPMTAEALTLSAFPPMLAITIYGAAKMNSQSHEDLGRFMAQVRSRVWRRSR